MTCRTRGCAATLGLLALAIGASYWAAPGESADKAPRTVLVADSAKPLPRHQAVVARDCIGRPRECVNGADGVVLAYSLKGRAPRTPMLARVLTDTNCDADRNGVSHCLNEMVLIATRRRITVRHDHHMHSFACLTPGERVRVVALDVALKAR